MATLRETSKGDFISGPLTDQNITIGALQRIADATEKMAGNFIQLQNDLTFYKRRKLESDVAIDRLHRRISALHGVNTKLKKKLNALQ